MVRRERVGSFLQSQFDPNRVKETHAARFRGYSPLIRHLYLDTWVFRYPIDLVVDGVMGPRDIRKILA